MKMPTRVLLCAVSMWVLALCTLVFGVLDTLREHHNSASLGVAIFLAVVACVPTAIAIAEHYTCCHQEPSVEHIIEVVDALHEGHRDVTRLH